MSPSPARIGLILAGGESRRMGGRSKALAPLGERPMIDHVIEHFEPQVDDLWLSVATSPGPIAHLGFRQLLDPEPSHCGPLAGLVQGLIELPEDGILCLAPCDAPLLPMDLAERLLAAMNEDHLAAVAREGEQLHPTFSAWRKRALPEVAKALASSKGLWQTLKRLPHAVAQWPLTRASPFYNVNVPGDLQRVEAWLKSPDNE